MSSKISSLSLWQRHKSAIVGGFLSGLLMIGLVAIIALTQQEQDIRQRAADQECQAGPADIVLVIDRSDSMNKSESGRTKLEWAKSAAATFVNTASNNQNSSQIRIGVVVYGQKGEKNPNWNEDIYYTKIVSGLTNDYSQLLTGIQGIEDTDSGTCLECGLKKATQLLSDSTSRKIVVLFADGEANHTWDETFEVGPAEAAAKSAADAGKAAGITYFTAHFGQPDKWDSMMKYVATSPQHYSFKPTVQEWVDGLGYLGEEICTQVEPTPTPSLSPSPSPSPSPTLSPTPSPSPSTSPTPTPSITPSPSPSPTPTSKPSACNISCSHNDDCRQHDSSYICYNNHCRRDDNRDDANCSVPLSYSCNSDCSNDTQCQTISSNYACIQGNCRLREHPNRTDCSTPIGGPEPTPTPTLTPTPSTIPTSPTPPPTPSPITVTQHNLPEAGTVGPTLLLTSFGSLLLLLAAAVILVP